MARANAPARAPDSPPRRSPPASSNATAASRSPSPSPISSIFAQNGGPSIGERLARAGLRFRAADNTRVGPRGALSGWDQVRARIVGKAGAPMLYVFATCRDFIRTVPSLRHDRQRPEDLDTDAEDHVADETRYACLARPWQPAEPERGGPADGYSRPLAPRVGGRVF